jgi:hypothetical protein
MYNLETVIVMLLNCVLFVYEMPLILPLHLVFIPVRHVLKLSLVECTKIYELLM